MRKMTKWTITVEMKSDAPVGEERKFVVLGDSAAHAKSRMRNRVEGIQYTKESRPYNPATDAGLTRLDD